MKSWDVTGGLGRLGNHHSMTVRVSGRNAAEAASNGRMLIRSNITEEIGADAPILGKILTITEIEEV